MMTEDDAKTKWCPFARVNSQVVDFRNQTTDLIAGGNRVVMASGTAHNNPEQARCIGSACMAWRWLVDAIGGDPVYERKPTPGVPGHFDNSPVGYCGLAGRP